MEPEVRRQTRDVFGGRTDKTLIHWMWKRRKEKAQDG